MRYQKSLFTRLFLFYTVLSIVLFAIIAGVISARISKQTMAQLAAYNRQQLASLDDAYARQVHSLSFLRERLYDVRTGTGITLYDSIRAIASDNSPTFTSRAHYSEYMSHTNMVFLYLNMIQNTTEYPPEQITIHSPDSIGQSFCWPISSLYAMYFERVLAAQIPAPPTHSPYAQRDADVRLLPDVAITSRPASTHYYVLYDYLWDRSYEEEQFNGFITYSYKMKNLNYVLDKSAQPLSGEAYLLDEYGMIVYSTTGEGHGQTFSMFEQVKSLSANGYFSTGDTVYNVLIAGGLPYYAVGCIPRLEVDRELNASRLLIGALMLLICATLLLLTRRTMKLLSRRIANLQQAMARAKTGDLSARAEVAHNDEIGMLALDCNDMIAKIDQYIKDEYVAALARKNIELQLRETALSALQAQIDPHFLYNALETIRMQAVLSSDDETAMLTEMLANVLRARLSGGHVVRLANELAACTALIEIMGARFCGELDAQVDIPQAVLELGILKDLLQPIVENAFVHGLYLCNPNAAKLLYIRSSQAGSKLTIAVSNATDSPSPFSGTHAPSTAHTLADMLALPQSSHKSAHIGLKNVNERIRIIYGAGCGVSFDDSQPGLFTVRLTILALPYAELIKITREG